MRNKFLLAVSALCCFLGAFAQNTTIKSGEKLVYTASYNMSGLMTTLAEVTMETSKVPDKNLFHLNLTAATYSKWDSYFKIRDQYQSYVSTKTLKPVLYYRNIDEGGYTKSEKYVFDYKNKVAKTTMQRRKKPETKKEVPINLQTSDVVATFYQLRNLNISAAKPGTKVTLTILFDGKEIPVVIKYMAKETISTDVFGKKECYKLSISAKTDALKGKDENLLWLTADAKKIPVLIKFNIPVGNGQLKLTKATGI